MLKLINVKASQACLYPKDTVYITCTFEATEDYPVKEYCEMYCDLIYGYQTLLESCPSSYRIKGNFYPQPMHLKKGESITASMRWTVPHNAYGGTYRLNIGVCDFEDTPLIKRTYVGDIEVAFPDVAPKFVNSHRNELNWELSKPQNNEYAKENEIEVYVRDLISDTVISQKVISENENFDTPYVSFSLIKENEKIILDNVEEKENYELLSVKMPTLLNAENSKFICSAGGGRLVDSKKSLEWGFEKKFQQKNVGILIDNDNYIMLDLPYLDDCIHYSVYSRNSKKYGALGVTLTYRIRKHGKDKSVKVINKPSFSVMRTKEFKDILYYLRGDLKKPTDFYDRGIFYYFQIECDGHNELNSFKDALNRVKIIHNMTGGVKQVVLLRGWQHTGHDTGYPDVFTLNKTGGTLEELKYVIEEAKKYNATITFHDNYDDLYEELPAYDKDIVALDEYNKPYKGWIWVSGLSRIISVPKYVKSGKMQERVKKTLLMYPVHSSYHLDVLSCEARRYDLDENVRMAAQEFVEYKKDVVKEFQKYGFNITSEGATQPFMGLIGHAWSGLSETFSLFTNDSYFPILGMYFHGILPVSCHLCTAGILNGAEIIPQILGDPTGYYKKEFYLYTLPMGLLYNSYIDSYEKSGNIHKVTYSDGSVLTYDENEIEIKTADGKYYTKNGNTLVKGFKENEYLGYTRGGKFSFEMSFKNIKEIFEIDFEGKKDALSYEIKENILIINAKPDTAFKIILEE